MGDIMAMTPFPKPRMGSLIPMGQQPNPTPRVASYPQFGAMDDPGLAYDKMRLQSNFNPDADKNAYNKAVLEFLKKAAPITDEFTARYGQSAPVTDEYLASRGLIRPKQQNTAPPIDYNSWTQQISQTPRGPFGNARIASTTRYNGKPTSGFRF
jgi:hypothetical protein